MKTKRLWMAAGLLAAFLCTEFALNTLTGLSDLLRTRTLPGSEFSPETVAIGFLDALAREDADKIRAMAVSKEEFAHYVWPGLPASRPGTNLTLDYVWNSLQTRSESGLRHTLSTCKGRRLHLLELRFAGQTSDYGSAKVHRDTRLRVRDETGRELELDLFGSMLEVGGEYKIFSFVR